MADPTLIEQLVAERKRQQVTQQQIADELDVTQTAISYWESGEREITLLAAEAYAEVLGKVIHLGKGGD